VVRTRSITSSACCTDRWNSPATARQSRSWLARCPSAVIAIACDAGCVDLRCGDVHPAAGRQQHPQGLGLDHRPVVRARGELRDQVPAAVVQQRLGVRAADARRVHHSRDELRGQAGAGLDERRRVHQLVERRRLAARHILGRGRL
jgi:hypothetical protein